MSILLVLLLGGLALSMVDFGSDDGDASSEPDEQSDENVDEGERFIGTDDADGISGTSYDDTIFAEGGDDEINGRAGSDLIRGGSGDDLIYDVSISVGFDELDAPDDHDTIYGGSGEDRIYGNLGVNEILGGRGDDFLSGTEFEHSEVPDISSPDTLFGGPGEDTLLGDDGDVLVGGSGEDEFVHLVRDPEDEMVTVTDYEPGEEIIIWSRSDALVDDDTPEELLPQVLGREDGEDVILSVNGIDLVRVLNTAFSEVFGNVSLVRGES